MISLWGTTATILVVALTVVVFTLGVSVVYLLSEEAYADRKRMKSGLADTNVFLLFDSCLYVDPFHMEVISRLSDHELDVQYSPFIRNYMTLEHL